jgi:hypothetical protein
MSMKYRLTTREVINNAWTVEADSPERAKAALLGFLCADDGTPSAQPDGTIHDIEQADEDTFDVVSIEEVK